VDKKNPFKKGTRSYEIWEKHNNPEHKDFWFDKVTGKITKRDEKIVEEALNVQS